MAQKVNKSDKKLSLDFLNIFLYDTNIEEKLNNVNKT